ncbi:outer membrane protein assembly factor BamB family protein [Streptomyces lavendulocolor]|uniref:serine/threonine-protein kinase n=1 Tax=Streptomyces lavendulocolor TaxID=67316 RepID=UPI003C2EDF01
MMLARLGEEDPRSLGGYTVLAVIGQDGMGRVYLGERAAGAPPVAIKTVRPGLQDDPEFRMRFAREARACERLSGAGTPRYRGADPDGRPPWLAVDYIHAPPLSVLVREAGPLPPPGAMSLVRELARILPRVHRLGLVHRDLKPGNVLVARQGPVIIDFGLLLDLASPTDPLDTDRRGTPGYAAPEHCFRRPVSEAADVYALGAILAFVLRGALPVEGPAVRRRRDGRPDITGLSAEAYELVADCMALDPADRPPPATVVARADALSRAATPGVARPGAFTWLPPAAQDVLRAYEEIRLPEARPATHGPAAATVPLPRPEPPAPTKVMEPRASSTPAGRPAAPRPSPAPPPPPHASPRQPAPPPLAGARWSARLPGRTYYAAPVLHRGLAVVAALDGTVRAFDARTGEVAWSRKLDGRVECPPATGGDTLIVSRADRWVCALHTSTGKELWRRPTGNTAPSTPVVAGDRVLLGDREGLVRALDAEAGDLLWTARTGDRAVHGAPAVHDGRVFVTSWDGSVYALDARDGTRLWEAPTGGELHGGPVVSGGTVHVGSRARVVCAFRASDGRQESQVPTYGPVRARPVAYGGEIWVGCLRGGLYGLGAGHGTAVRRLALGAAVHSEAAVDRHSVYAGTSDGRVHRLRRDGGPAHPWYDAGAPVEAGLRTGYGLLFVVGTDCRLHAVDLGADTTRRVAARPPAPEPAP